MNADADCAAWQDLRSMTEAQVDRLRAIFALVEDKTNWKLPINATVLAGEATAEEIRQAVIFCAGCEPLIRPTTVPMRHRDGLVSFDMPALHVTAVGYYEATGE